MNGNGEYGVRYEMERLRGRTVEVVTKERFFLTDAERERYATQVIQRHPRFVRFLAWTDPRPPVDADADVLASIGAMARSLGICLDLRDRIKSHLENLPPINVLIPKPAMTVEEALADMLDLVGTYIAEAGPCDHDVNICICDLRRRAEKAAEALDAARGGAR